MESEKILKRREYCREWRKENPEKSKASSNKWREKNRQRDLENKSKYRKENKEKIKKSYRQSVLKSKFGLSRFDYDKMLLEQSHVCAICKNSCSTGRSLAVDHDHRTGLIRGLLCRECNVSIGLMKDDSDRLRAAAAYLEAKETNMSEWIEINLPWCDRTDHGPEYRNYPDFSAQIREMFGSEYEELDKLLTPHDNQHSAEFLRIRRELDDSGIEDTEQALIDLHNPSVDLVLRWRELCRQASDWESVQPETLEVERQNSSAAEEYKKVKGTISFRDNDLCRPGVLIEAVNGEGETFQLLIGHINTVGGVCNDCSGICDEDIVKRCRVVWVSEKKENN